MTNKTPMVPQSPYSLIHLAKIECYQGGSRENIQEKMLQHQTQILQHHIQKSSKKGNILGIINASGLL
jgi:hypothetical protein